MRIVLQSAGVLMTVIALALLVMPQGSEPRAAGPAATAAVLSAPTSIGDLIPAPLTSDPEGDAGNAIDITGVSFKQRGVELELRISTSAPVKLDELGASGRSLCLRLTRGPEGTAGGSICLGGDDDAARLRYNSVDSQQRSLKSRQFAIGIDRPDDTTLVTTIRPGAIDLVRRDFSWQLVSKNTGGACDPAAPCTDLAPDAGPAEGFTSSVVAPRCFGASARPDRGSCSNAALRLSVVPTPDDAQLQPNSYCRPLNRGATLNPCKFGYESTGPSGTIALIGDSHAVHWRAALAQLANAKHWVGVSVAGSGCRFSAEAPTQPDPAVRKECLKLRSQIYPWLRRHPEIHTVFIGNHIGSFARQPAYGLAARGSAAAIDRLPKSVKNVFVIRDVPHNSYRTTDCIAAAMREGIPAGPACALTRKRALAPDPTVEGVAISKRKGVHVINLTSRFCSKLLCPPVIGGALVHKDISHLTDVYSNSLGPAFIQRYNQIMGPRR